MYEQERDGMRLFGTRSMQLREGKECESPKRGKKTSGSRLHASRRLPALIDGFWTSSEDEGWLSYSNVGVRKIRSTKIPICQKTAGQLP